MLFPLVPLPLRQHAVHPLVKRRKSSRKALCFVFAVASLLAAIDARTALTAPAEILTVTSDLDATKGRRENHHSI